MLQTISASGYFTKIELTDIKFRIWYQSSHDLLYALNHWYIIRLTIMTFLFKTNTFDRMVEETKVVTTTCSFKEIPLIRSEQVIASTIIEEAQNSPYQKGMLADSYMVFSTTLISKFNQGSHAFPMWSVLARSHHHFISYELFMTITL